MEYRNTLAEWILDMAEGEPVEAVVIGVGPGPKYIPNFNEQPKCVVLSWEQALPFISYEFDSGYGAPGCNRIYAWTASWVIFVSQHDGSTSPKRIPRNPCPCEPDMPGGYRKK